ncbi:hypothetical protein [Halobacteriovorax marinus]|uniref:hypothetical protein n=1 Tax=Halobacteriovorax marinus TaxID=97084 RepID=UPI003A8DCE39
MLKNEGGFSLAQVIVAAGLLGVLSLAFMQLTKNMGQQQNFAQSKNDELELATNIRMLLNDERYCRVSIAGNGEKGAPDSPVTFRKSSNDEDGEGLDIALYTSNVDGTTRVQKKFNGQNNPGSDDKSKYGKVTIKSIKLIFNNPNGDGNLNWDYEDSASTNDVAIVRVVTEKKISATKTRTMTDDYDIVVNTATGQTPESTGVSRIISCNSEALSKVNEDYYYPINCSMTLAHSDNGGSYHSATLYMSSGGFIGVRLKGDVNSDDRFRLAANCGSGGDLTDYFKSCQVGFGWRDSTDNGSSVNRSPLGSREYNFNFGSSATLQTGGDVNEDDSFYYRMRCPDGSNEEVNSYVKQKCLICMGHTDHWYSSPEKASCKKIQNMSDNSWGRIMTSGDVGADDALFLGFFCGGEFAPIIKSWGI